MCQSESVQYRKVGNKKGVGWQSYKVIFGYDLILQKYFKSERIGSVSSKTNIFRSIIIYVGKRDIKR